MIAIFTSPVEEFAGREGKPFAPPGNRLLVSLRRHLSNGADSGFQLLAPIGKRVLAGLASAGSGNKISGTSRAADVRRAKVLGASSKLFLMKSPD
jgi:hypothetical protein